MVDWLERVLTSGRAPYQTRDYAVYRNGPQADSTTTAPALVYFPRT